MEDAYELWIQNLAFLKFRDLLVVILWHVWYYKNLAIFEEKFIPSSSCALKGLAIFNLYPQEVPVQKVTIVTP